MKKLLWLLFMPFFMACGGEKNHPNDTALRLQEMLAAKNWDSLSVLGKTFEWHGKADTKDSGFRAYLLLNTQIGNALYKEGKLNKAAVFFDNITKHRENLQTDSFPKIFVNAFYKAADSKYSGNYDPEVVADFEKCRLYQQQSILLDTIDYFNLLQSLGISYHVLGEKEVTKYYYDTALQYAKLCKLPRKIASAYINLSQYFIDYGQSDSIIANVPAILQLKGVNLKRIATLKAYYAEALYKRERLGYKEHLKDALDSLQQIDYTQMGADEWGKKSDVLKLYGTIALKQKNYPDAIAYYKKALDTCLKKTGNSYKHRSYAKLLLSLATVYDSLGQYDSALYYSQFALACVTPVDSAHIAANPGPADLYTENTIMEALDCKAGLLEKKYALTHDKALLENAITCYKLAFAVEQKLLDNFTYDNSRAEMQKTSKARSGRAIQACYQLYQLTGNNGWAEKAFQFSENSKALILLEAIKKNIRKSRNKDNPLFKRVDSLQLQLAYTERELLTDKKGDAAAIARKSRLENELNDALAELDNQELGYKKYRQPEDTAVLGALREKLLTNNRYLAEYFCADSNRYLFVVKQTGDLVFAKLGDSIVPQIDSLMEFFKANNKKDAGAYQQAAYQLFKACKLQAILSAQELLIIPDGPFNQLPFDALVTGINGNSGFKSMDYLFQKIITSYGYSATSLLKQLDNADDVATATIAAFAPLFKAQERGLDSLPNSETEVSSIKADPTFIGPQATVAKLKQSFKYAGTIHIASHASAGFVASAGGFRSGTDTTADAEPRIEMYDSSFFMKDLYATSLLHTDLVVLSACQTNQGNINQSEGTLSLARGFYYAGAKNIVASLWNVDDKSTTAIMKEFYGNGNAGHYAAKLRDAKKKFLENERPNGLTQPYFWAALMHIGGFGKEPQSSYGWVYGAAVAILLLAAGLLYQRRRKR